MTDLVFDSLQVDVQVLHREEQYAIRMCAKTREGSNERERAREAWPSTLTSASFIFLSNRPGMEKHRTLSFGIPSSFAAALSMSAHEVNALHGFYAWMRITSDPLNHLPPSPSSSLVNVTYGGRRSGRLRGSRIYQDFDPNRNLFGNSYHFDFALGLAVVSEDDARRVGLVHANCAVRVLHR